MTGLQKGKSCMDLTKAVLPDFIVVNGAYLRIHTEHFYWLRFAQIIEQEQIALSEIKHLLIDDLPEGMAAQPVLNALVDFYSKRPLLPRDMGNSDGARYLDYEVDSDLIYAAFMECYGIDIFEKPIHWHKFLALLSGLHDTMLTEVMGHRGYKGKDKDFKRLRAAWELPPRKKEQEADDLWKKTFGG